MLQDFVVGSVADCITGGKVVPGPGSKLFENVQTRHVIRYVPVKQPPVEPREVKLKRPVHKSVRELIGRKKQSHVLEEGETSKTKKRKLEQMFETETKDLFKKKMKKKVAFSECGDFDTISGDFVESGKKKKKYFEFETTDIEDGKGKYKYDNSRKEKRSKITASEFTETSTGIFLGKKKRKDKHIVIETEGIAKTKRKQEGTFNHSSELDIYTYRHNESVEESEELSNKQCALKRLEKKKLKELKLQQVDEKQNDRTVFVGNVPNDISKKKLKKFFSKYGAVKTVRLRCAPLADPRIPKKVAIIKQKYHPERSNIHVFVCFEDVESTHKALEANGSLIGEHHIRVDLLHKKLNHDQKKAVFIGNLPFAAEEDDLWKMFESCGEINNVRIVRDKITGVGKGFAYINFEAADAVELAIKLDGEEMKNRKLRVLRCVRKPEGKFINRHRSSLQKHGRMESSAKRIEHEEIKETFNRKKKFENKTNKLKAAESGTQKKIIKKKMKTSYQGQKVAEKKKFKKNKRKLNRAELKKKILVNKLGVTTKAQKGSRNTI